MSDIVILVVDDDPEKADCVEATLQNELGFSMAIERAETLSDAYGRITSSRIDIVVLDLLVPYIKNQLASAESGREFLQFLESYYPHIEVFGLSAFPNEITGHRKRFESLGRLLFHYNQTDTAWISGVKRCIERHVGRLGASSAFDAVGFFALEEEANPYVSLARERVPFDIRGIYAEALTFDIGAKNLRMLAVTLPSMGLVASASTCARCLSTVNARVAFMSGICGGYSSRCGMGDIIIASPAWDYQSGKWKEEDFKIAPLQVNLQPDVRSQLSRIANDAGTMERIDVEISRAFRRPSLAPRVRLGPVASGSAVIASSSRLAEVEGQHRHVLAVDMEIYGFYFACTYTVDTIPFFAAKSVVDFADKDKDDDFHKYGSEASARFCLLAVQRIIAASGN